MGGDHVRQIIQDSRGFLWFCTSEGLSRFDGYSFVTYGMQHGLPYPAVTCMIGGGRAWREHSHRFFPHAPHIREAASPFKIRSRCKSASQPVDYLTGAPST
jgi:ligand-binding sensor domain-containing protein